MLRLLKFTLFSAALAADTCSNDVTGDDKCMDDMSALQADVTRHDKIIPMKHKHGAPEVHVSKDIHAATEPPQPSKQCSSFGARLFFSTAQGIVNGIIASIASDSELSKTESAAVRIHRNWLTTCETFANFSVTGSATGLDGLRLSEFQCIDTNFLNTVFQVYMELTIPALTFSGEGRFQLQRNGSERRWPLSGEGRCIIGDKLLPQAAATIGATADNITLSALVNVSNLQPIDASDIQIQVAHVGDFKCGALTEPVNLDFLNEVCSFFLTPVANLLLQPITRIINKALNAAAANHFNQTASLVEKHIEDDQDDQDYQDDRDDEDDEDVKKDDDGDFLPHGR